VAGREEDGARRVVEACYLFGHRPPLRPGEGMKAKGEVVNEETCSCTFTIARGRKW
jgi:hypothetical protein